MTRIVNIEQKVKILEIAEERLKDGHDVVIQKEEIKLMASVLEAAYKAGEIELDLGE